MRAKGTVVVIVVGLVAGFLGIAAVPAQASTTFTVIQNGDQSDFDTADNLCDVNPLQKGNQCTLRAAIQQANATAGADTITFSVGSGAQTISPGSALPATTEAVTIDGTTQPGFAGTPLITLSGLSAGSASGLTLAVTASTVKSLMIDSFSGDGISITAGGGDIVRGCWIGIDVLSADKGNTGDGIRVGGTGTDTIGGTGAFDGNVISGNNTNGIEVLSTAFGYTILGNRIGTNAGGTAAVGNGNGMVIRRGAGLIGGNIAAAANLISGNAFDGIVIAGATATLVDVEGNLIGTNVTGSGAIPNGGDGVGIIDAPGNRVGSSGGTHLGACQNGCNLIADNAGAGLSVTESVPGLSASNVIEGNIFLSNATGLSIGAAGTTVGGTGDGDGNTISGNTTGIGVNATGTQVLGNRIGTNGLGNIAFPNSTGVDVTVGPNTVGGTTGTTPGGACTGACNLISGNTSDGVHIELGVTNVAISGNMVGLDVGGSTAVPNGTGIEVQGSSNTVGGTAVGAGNVISGNFGTGVQIDGVAMNPLPTLNVAQGNRIGTTPAGTASIGNLQGVLITDATKNTIGGTTGTTPGGACTGACNVISGNVGRGVDIANADTTGNIVSGNFVGTDTTGTVTAGLGNGGPGGGPGIRVETSASGTVIGGTKTSARNVISGNSGEGIDLEGALKTKVQGNYIGTDTTGTVDLGNGEFLAIHEPGVTVFGGSGNAIGGKGGSRNLISGNGEAGVLIDGAAKSTKVQGNLIGTKANGTSALGNAGDGIEIADGTKSTIGGTTAGLGNTVWFNGGAGISVTVGTGDAIRQNSIWSNVGLGIDLDPAGVNANDNKDPDPGPNLRQNYPVITSASKSGSTIVISGTFNSTVNATNFTLEFFSSPTCDVSGFGEGQTFLGLIAAVATDANGNATWTVTLPVSVAPGSAITATATDSKADTSELSACRTST
jgi:titin